MADTAGRVRELEFDLETVLATARERDDRCLLRGAGRTEPHRRLRADVRLDGGPGPRLGGRCKGGQQDQALGRSRGGFSTKIHLKTDFSGLPLAFVLTGGEAGDSPQFETLLDLGSDVRPPRRRHRQRLRQQAQSRRRPRPRHRSDHSLQSQRQEETRLLSKSPLPDQGAHRADLRKAQTLQTHRVTLREDQSELRSVRLPRPRIHPHQIRPHDLVASLAGEDRLQWYAQNLLMMREETLRLARRNLDFMEIFLETE